MVHVLKGPRPHIHIPCIVEVRPRQYDGAAQTSENETMAQTTVDELIREYAAIDAVAEDILSEKHQIVDLDSKRNKGREALRQLKKLHPSFEDGRSHQSWVCFGNTFLKMNTAACIRMLEQDQRTLDTEINGLRDGLKPKVAQLHKMEGRAEVKGFELKGMSIEEILHARDLD